jgi:hypothetical protein
MYQGREGGRDFEIAPRRWPLQSHDLGMDSSRRPLLSLLDQLR